MEITCPICKLRLTKLNSITIEKAIRNRVWLIESSFSVGERKIKEWLKQLKDEEVDSSYKYHKYCCKHCGFIHDGTLNVADMFPMK